MDTAFASIIENLRRYTAFRAWFAEVLILFALLTLARLAAQVWNGVVLDDATVWAAWWAAFDGAGSFADDALALSVSLTALIEGGVMFLAKKRIAIAREDGHEEGRVEGRVEGRAEGRAERAALAAQIAALTADNEERAALAAQIAALTADNERMQEEIHRLRNGHSTAGPSD